MTQVCITVNCGSADIQTNKRRMKSLKGLLLSGEAIVDDKVVLHRKVVSQDKSKGNLLIRLLSF